jgi:serine protease
MATPHVSAAAALLIAAQGPLTPNEVYSALTSSAADLGEPGFDKTSGYGLLQAHDALVYQPATCTDADADGWCAEEGDCDDTDATVHPGHNDTRGRWGRNGVDNDCDGVIDG